MFAPSNVLLIRHLPATLADDEKDDLLKHFGAKSTRCMPSYGKMRHSAFANFSTNEEAQVALSRLHQLEILGSQLIVQYAKSKDSEHFPHESDFKEFDADSHQDNKKPVQNRKENLLEKVEEFKKRLNAIAPDMGLDYPFPPSLKYKYPNPTPSIIANIAHALSAVPKFYTQVLHLMNKMNLPAPFGLVTTPPPLQPDPPNLVGLNSNRNIEPDSYIEEQMDVISEEESEFESESDIEKSDKKTIKRPTKRAKKRMKKPRIQQLINTTTVSTGPKQKPSDVFETVDMEAKTIQFSLKPTEEQISDYIQEEKQETDITVVEGGFGVIEPQKIEEEDSGGNESDDEQMWQGVKFIRSSELDRNRLSSREMKSSAVFKKYQAGTPTYRLYVKNLAKQVDEKTLLSIYGKYINRKIETEKNMFDVRLMKEGRMKGQAFITLANEKQAAKALKDTHGYMLHGKPIVVQFARSARPKENVDCKKTTNTSSK